MVSQLKLLGGNMKKLTLLLALTLVLVGCGSNTTGDDDGSANSLTNIMIYSRDESSGTRSAFEEIVGIESLTQEAAVASSNGDLATQVGQNKEGMGYVSLSTDFAKNNIKSLSYEGVAAEINTVVDGSYSLARPFAYVTRAEGNFDSDDKQALVAAFIDFLENSTEGRQLVLAAGGITDVEGGTDWDTLKENHPIVNQDNSGMTLKTGGSTSVSNTLQAALEGFQPYGGNFQFEMNHTGSGAAYASTLGDEKDSTNQVDIGFASRDFKADSEPVSDGYLTGTYAKDAVVVVVQKDNPLTNVTQQQVKDIFEGNLTAWADLD